MSNIIKLAGLKPTRKGLNYRISIVRFGKIKRNIGALLLANCIRFWNQSYQLFLLNKSLCGSWIKKHFNLDKKLLIFLVKCGIV